MRSIFDNLINGNLADAKRAAKRFGSTKLYRYALDELGWPVARAAAAFRYLKRPSAGTWQAYCDASRPEGTK